MSHLNPFGQSRYEKSSTRFLVTICQTNIKDKTLGLPSSFVREYGDELSDIVKLTDPAGHVWLVDLTKGKNNFWFDGDWVKFMRYHSIGDGCSLVFKYEGMFKGTSHFRVHAFDKTNSEIQYSNNEQRIDVEEQCNNRKKGLQHHQDMEDSEEMNRFRSEFRPTTSKGRPINQTNTSNRNTARPNSDSGHHRSRKQQHEHSTTPEENSLPEPESHKRRRKSRVKTEVLWTDDEDYANACNGNNDVDADIDVDLQGIIVPRSFSGLYRKASPETRRAVQMACELKPENDAFMIILQGYNIKAGYLYVPAAFTNKYLQDPGKYVKLLVSDGKEYSVGICRRGCAGRMCLTWGWPEFSRANGLRTAGVCRFDLVPSAAGITLKTSVFHAYNY